MQSVNLMKNVWNILPLLLIMCSKFHYSWSKTVKAVSFTIILMYTNEPSNQPYYYTDIPSYFLCRSMIMAYVIF